MLRANYYAPERCISATKLAQAAGYESYGTGNIQYGVFAHKIADLMGIEPDVKVGDETRWTYLLCEAAERSSVDGHFQWRLRPEVAQAMEAAGVVKKTLMLDALDDINQSQLGMGELSEKAREAYVKARIGQGAYRLRLITYWGGCSVTGFDAHEMLVASHIMPWRDCTPSQAVDMVNGLLLLPNLDKAFDRGLISFDPEGAIMISPRLTTLSESLGIHPSMKIRSEKLLDLHEPYLRHHRENVFVASV